MKKIFLLGLVCLLTAMPALAEDHSHHHPTSLQGEKPTGKSLYWLGGQWKTHQNQKLELKSLKGKPVVLAMLYTSCKAVCPLILEDVKAIEKGLASADRAKTQFVIVSFDPERDTPSVLADYAQKHGIRASNWKFLHGTSKHVSELGALLGVRFQPNAQGDFIHSNQITLLNVEGEVAYQRPDLKEPLTIILEKLKANLPVSHPHQH
ncbi:hypothetical protein COW36_19180 [bacterium (Candidatus Blackallbacteria) CG17_big_fil_post_rev_8_21_14_2_50_48_46]|uniref:SCO family protein n=1 Tax=bacterium (Candidatus Blackallbacteria) CG17_big_fil_post_rev_8_21_14_2_50_48_46 TaxID=2014261 RepID=A0A2M7G188_9BACT|nr:MAG: hypothetical protein COW64_25290 [bacterium (Candidatus Blackallbacteria) CG18_big_fil_WC_8_21_14_2_50_49_26]PIW15048.1 MAG: hypothetical protein COW36_19180 [bacterium (Candidatus Blackallbacteria) CG17_big_fil_post_rev_8_21_14_2_50_48_46]PIW47629.1 MAG: hypothetical protein COW20_12140 [bacterium (Candidatus Blackallbacteria) CG13_big_fil_rev_8_21_14_2_50_49_14]